MLYGSPASRQPVNVTVPHWDIGAVSPAHAVARAKRGAAARRLPSTVVLGGLQSADDNFDDRISELLKGLDVESWTIVTDAQDSDFGRAQVAALKVLAIFRSGFAEIRGRRVTVVGVAPGAETERLHQELAAELPKGYTIARFAVALPGAEPYSFSAYRNESDIIEFSGGQVISNCSTREGT
jgi:hypothetical protein